MSTIENERPTDLSPVRRAAARAQLTAVVEGRVSTRWRPPRAAVIATAISFGAAVSVGAVTLLTHAPVSDRTSVECRATLDPDEEGNYIATVTPVVISTDGTQTLPRPEFPDAVNLCAQVWQASDWQGGQTSEMSLPPTFDDKAPPTAPVPALTLCVADDGHAVVVPSDDPQICSDLGLSGGPA